MIAFNIKTKEYGYLYDGRPVYKQGEYYQW